jgi:hypothetical protein
MRNTTLQFLNACVLHLSRVGHDVGQRDPIQADELLEIDIPTKVPIDVLERSTKVGPVPVRFQDVSVLLMDETRGSDVNKECVGRGL